MRNVREDFVWKMPFASMKEKRTALAKYQVEPLLMFKPFKFKSCFFTIKDHQKYKLRFHSLL